jgi:sulfane dehydrogenase subunit SoxC
MGPKSRGDAPSHDASETISKKNRRGFLKQSAALVTGAASAGVAQKASAQGLAGQPWERVYGAGFTGYGQPSRFEQPVQRHVAKPYGDLAPGSGVALAPIEALEGIITPSGLHNNRSHSGTPDIDPKEHQLLLHGLVQRPLRFSMEALSSYPMTTRIHFLECSGNSSRSLAPQPLQVPAGAMHGNIACSEWTGVPLRVLLEEAGLLPQAKWILAEGADSAHMSRSIPLEKALDDAMIALYQNGERLRPEQGYPVRLLLPGWEGNMNVKWLRRIKATEEPTYTKDETSKYTDLQPDGRALQFTFEMGVKSVITKPSSTMKLPRTGFYEISGIAWSGAGCILRRWCHLGRCRAHRTGTKQGPGAFSPALGMDGEGGGAAEPRNRPDGAGAAGAQGVAGAVLARQRLSQPLHRELGRGCRREREKCLRLSASL